MRITCIILLLQVRIFGYTTEDSTVYLANSATAFTQDSIPVFVSLLDSLSSHSEVQLFKEHCRSIKVMITSKATMTDNELSFISLMFRAFSDSSVASNTSNMSSYLERKRPFIIAWRSPADSIMSLAWLLLPEQWDSAKAYPLYVTLHGLYGPYQNPIEYMSRYMSPDLVVEKSFEDGYSLFPWGRGNIWYEGIGETDVWESISAAENLVRVDTTRKYILGHSMGGYGALMIAEKSANVWAALGIYAGALSYNGNKLLTTDAIQKINDLPTYFVCGTNDGLLSVNQTAYQILLNAGNLNISFNTFEGGHESLLENWQNMFTWMKNWSNVTDVNKNVEISPAEYFLSQNFPNPFNPSTVIRYQVPVRSIVILKIFDILGRDVATLVNDMKNPGAYEAKWNAASNTSGIYLYKLQLGNFAETKKMILLK